MWFETLTTAATYQAYEIIYIHMMMVLGMRKVPVAYDP